MPTMEPATWAVPAVDAHLCVEGLLGHTLHFHRTSLRLLWPTDVPHETDRRFSYPADGAEAGNLCGAAVEPSNAHSSSIQFSR